MHERSTKSERYEGTKLARWNATKLDAERINRLKKKKPKMSEPGLTIIGGRNARSPQDRERPKGGKPKGEGDSYGGSFARIRGSKL